MRIPTFWACALAVAGTLGAPAGVSAQFAVQPRATVFWTIAGGAVAGAALFDEQARIASLEHRSPLLDHLADAGNRLGTGKHLIAGMALTYVAARIAHRRRTADGVLRVAAGYAASNVIVSVLKPVVGRHRPDSTNDAWRFHGAASEGAWHSFPSSHAVHAFSLAAGAALVSRNDWVAGLGYTAAGVVGWSRLYDDQHWASDVTTSAALGIATAATTLRWLDRRFPRSDPQSHER